MADVTYSDRPKYHVVDRDTGKTVGSYYNKTRARNEVDKRDNEHGGYKHAMVAVHSGKPSSELEKLGAGAPMRHQAAMDKLKALNGANNGDQPMIEAPEGLEYGHDNDKYAKADMLEAHLEKGK